MAQVEASSPTRLVVRVPDRAQSGRVVVQSGELEAPGGARFDVLEGGLTGAYHHIGDSLSAAPGVEGRAPTLVRVDSTLDFGEDLSFALPFSPGPFEAVWTGAIVAPVDGDYVLALRSGDPARLLVDGERVVEVEGGHPRRIIEARASLAAGPHAVRIEFLHGEGLATLRFGWRPPGGKLAIVPQSALLPEAP